MTHSRVGVVATPAADVACHAVGIRRARVVALLLGARLGAANGSDFGGAGVMTLDPHRDVVSW